MRRMRREVRERRDGEGLDGAESCSSDLENHLSSYEVKQRNGGVDLTGGSA